MLFDPLVQSQSLRHDLVHETMGLPFGIEGGALVRDADVFGQGRNDVLIPQAFDEIAVHGSRELAAQHPRAKNLVSLQLLLGPMAGGERFARR